MELFDLYTAEREKTGRTMVRGEPVPEGYYRLVVHVCIFDPEGRMLIQQAERETREELGLSVNLADTRPTLTIYWDRGFDDYYAVTLAVDPASLRLQYEEVQAARWASREEILQMIDDGRFIPYEKSLIDLLFFRRNHRSAHTRGDWTRGRG